MTRKSKPVQKTAPDAPVTTPAVQPETSSIPDPSQKNTAASAETTKPAKKAPAKKKAAAAPGKKVVKPRGSKKPEVNTAKPPADDSLAVMHKATDESERRKIERKLLQDGKNLSL